MIASTFFIVMAAALSWLHVSDRFPASNNVPLPLGQFPTRVTVAGDLRVKRDDEANPSGYGGNKVRKLSYLLEDSRSRGLRRLVTIGAAGSHHVLATAYYGRQEGFEVAAVLVPQPRTDHVVETLRATLAQGALVTPARFGWAGVPVQVATLLARRGTGFIATGGSSPLGTRGYVDAAAEIVGEDPSEVVCALGSGGTAAGLAIGAVLQGLSCTVHGVLVADPKGVVPWLTRRLVEKTARLVDPRSRTLAREALKKLVIVTDELGRGYGYATARGDAATGRAAAAGIALDGTYTAKAYAYAEDRVRRAGASARPVLYLHTLSSSPLAPLLGDRAPENVGDIYACLLPSA
jgi:1-aminocyclopropane-1-carboxylate deaminase/D-cysteine desulfhydrase-like pyridoxal-dependent ACC family enzyme